MGKKQKKSFENIARTPRIIVSEPISGLAVFSAALLLVYVLSLSWAARLRNDNFHDPVKLWASVVNSAPDKRRSHENYGQALSSAGKLNEALKELKTVLALPDDGSVPMRDVYRELGVVYFRLNLIEESVISWQNGLRHAPNDPGLLNNISIALMRQRRYDEALSYAQVALTANSYMPEPFNTVGEVYLAKGEFNKAVEAFQRFLQLRPEDSRGYWNVALALEKAGDYERAIQYTNQFLARETNPRYIQNATEFLKMLQSKTDQRKGKT